MSLKSLAIFENPSHWLKKEASIFLKISSKRIEIFKKKPQFTLKSLKSRILKKSLAFPKKSLLSGNCHNGQSAPGNSSVSTLKQKNYRLSVSFHRKYCKLSFFSTSFPPRFNSIFRYRSTKQPIHSHVWCEVMSGSCHSEVVSKGGEWVLFSFWWWQHELFSWILWYLSIIS
jgi:hypothetical protein